MLFRTLAILAVIGGANLIRAAPSLVVVLAIDQFRGDYFDRYREHFVEDGFNLLLRQGAVFTDCRYRHAVSKTACGHAVILTGVHANVHGIIGNAWVDRATLKKGNCVEDDRVKILGLPEEDRGGARLPGLTVPLGASPRRLLASTVGDELKISGPGRSKVIGISSKDRSAILLAGKLGDAAYWMEYQSTTPSATCMGPTVTKSWTSHCARIECSLPCSASSTRAWA